MTVDSRAPDCRGVGSISLALSGCSVIITTGIFSDVSTSHGVQIVAAVSAHCTALDTVTARVTNIEHRAVFVPSCGSGPLLLTQEFVNGAWTDGENAACDAADALTADQARSRVYPRHRQGLHEARPLPVRDHRRREQRLQHQRSHRVELVRASLAPRGGERRLLGETSCSGIT